LIIPLGLAFGDEVVCKGFFGAPLAALVELCAVYDDDTGGLMGLEDFDGDMIALLMLGRAGALRLESKLLLDELIVVAVCDERLRYTHRDTDTDS